MTSFASGGLEFTNPLQPQFWVQNPAAIDAELAYLRDQSPTFFPEQDASELGLPVGEGAWVCLLYTSDAADE